MIPRALEEITVSVDRDGVLHTDAPRTTITRIINEETHARATVACIFSTKFSWKCKRNERPRSIIKQMSDLATKYKFVSFVTVCYDGPETLHAAISDCHHEITDRLVNTYLPDADARLTATETIDFDGNPKFITINDMGRIEKTTRTPPEHNTLAEINEEAHTREYIEKMAIACDLSVNTPDNILSKRIARMTIAQQRIISLLQGRIHSCHQIAKTLGLTHSIKHNDENT